MESVLAKLFPTGNSLIWFSNNLMSFMSFTAQTEHWNDMEVQQYHNQKIQLWFAFEPQSKTKFKSNRDVSLNILGMSLAHVSISVSAAAALLWKMPPSAADDVWILKMYN